ncbi:MAG: hypothetical protein J5478_06135 [Bacteroidales bacterium]|nr:hypothetical protein [Bacteroidales bacterium]
MSCFLVPLTQAAVTSIVRSHHEKKIQSGQAGALMRHLPALEKMLWGGAVVLLVDHAIHGELLTFSLRELLTVGVPMSVVLTGVWAVYALVKERRRKVAPATK